MISHLSESWKTFTRKY